MDCGVESVEIPGTTSMPWWCAGSLDNHWVIASVYCYSIIGFRLQFTSYSYC
jgi:hypothetical protein